MAKELQHDVATALVLDAPDGIVATSATLTFRKPSGGTVELPAVTLPSLSTTVAAGSTATVLNLASAAGFVVGQLVRLDCAGVSYMRRIASIADHQVTLLSALPAAPTTGDPVRSVRMSATVAAPGAALLGANYSLEWSYADASRRATHREMADVVRFPFVDPLAAHDVAELLAFDYQDVRPEGWCAAMAARACERVRAELRARGDRPHLFIDAGLFRESCQSALAILLSEAGYNPSNSTVEDRKKSLQAEFAAGFLRVAQSLAPFDGNDDGAVAGDAEERRHVYAFRVSR